MLESKRKIKTRDFLRHIEFLGQSSSHRITEGFQGTERQLLIKFTTATSDFLEKNEPVVGLENLLTNIYEIEFALDKKAIELARDAVKECETDHRDWTFIEELVK